MKYRQDIFVVAQEIMRIEAFSEKYREAVVELWQQCKLTVAWNDPHKDIDRKLKVNPELFLVGTLDGELTTAVTDVIAFYKVIGYDDDCVVGLGK